MHNPRILQSLVSYYTIIKKKANMRLMIVLKSFVVMSPAHPMGCRKPPISSTMICKSYMQWKSHSSCWSVHMTVCCMLKSTTLCAASMPMSHREEQRFCQSLDSHCYGGCHYLPFPNLLVVCYRLSSMHSWEVNIHGRRILCSWVCPRIIPCHPSTLSIINKTSLWHIVT